LGDTLNDTGRGGGITPEGRGRGGGVAKRQKIRTWTGKDDPPCSNASRFSWGSMTVGGGVTQTLQTSPKSTQGHVVLPVYASRPTFDEARQGGHGSLLVKVKGWSNVATPFTWQKIDTLVTKKC